MTNMEAELLQVTGLCQSFGKHQVLENISFTLMAGEVLGLVGESGSGKTTLTRKLVETFGDDVSVIYHDNYYKRLDHLSYEERCKVNYDHPDSFETDLMVEDLKLLESEGVTVLTCGTCLDFYGLKEKLAVGGVTNMYDIVERMEKASAIIKP